MTDAGLVFLSQFSFLSYFQLPFMTLFVSCVGFPKTWRTDRLKLLEYGQWLFLWSVSTTFLVWHLHGDGLLLLVPWLLFISEYTFGDYI